MATEQWTDDKLDKLANVVNQLVNQVQQLTHQSSQLGAQLERTTQSLDALVSAMTVDRGSLTKPQSFKPETDWLSRLTMLEELVHHLTQRIQYLERRELAVSTVPAPALIEDDDIEDAPDEILWDFMEPNSNS